MHSENESLNKVLFIDQDGLQDGWLGKTFLLKGNFIIDRRRTRVHLLQSNVIDL